jgi:hypothetical protein
VDIPGIAWSITSTSIYIRAYFYWRGNFPGWVTRRQLCFTAAIARKVAAIHFTPKELSKACFSGGHSTNRLAPSMQENVLKPLGN